MLCRRRRSILFPYTTLFRSVALQARSWDCVIVGGGIREPEEQLELFESIINLICRHAPQAAIAFNHIPHDLADAAARDRKSTRLNSSHLGISYAVFCLKKKN